MTDEELITFFERQLAREADKWAKETPNEPHEVVMFTDKCARLIALARIGAAVKPFVPIIVGDKVPLQSKAIKGYYLAEQCDLTFAELAKLACALEALPHPIGKP